MNAIEIQQLTKQFNDIAAVKSLSLAIRPGELFTLLGVNGAGKSTLIRMLSCLTAPTSGDAFLMGHSILHDPQKVKNVIAVSPQETALAKGLTVRENLMLICGAHGFSKGESLKKTTAMMEKMNLTALANKKTEKLSGGWQRRLSIAMALISDPKILFLDEPTLGLDVLARRELWDLILSLKGQITVLLTTHYMEEAQTLSDRIAILQEGSILLTDTPAAILEKTCTERLEDAFIRIVRGDMQ
ncbi:MAG: ABC transporter ATP-binding protein [Clostridiales bacterium]|nr:ABC transporter ATP-binding protein [Clostridiales bacterium]